MTLFLNIKKKKKKKKPKKSTRLDQKLSLIWFSDGFGLIWSSVLKFLGFYPDSEFAKKKKKKKKEKEKKREDGVYKTCKCIYIYIYIFEFEIYFKKP